MTTISIGRPDMVGPALREARRAEGMTQSGAAALADVGRQWLNEFEAGDKASAPLDMVMRVAAVLSVTVELTPPRPPEPAEDDAEPIDLDALLDGLDS